MAFITNPVADRREVVADAMHRQYGTIDAAQARAARAKRHVELLQRMLWGVPLHEWAEAKVRGNNAVCLLLEAYTPANAAWMTAEGRTPRCPPWATRRYREAVGREREVRA